MKTFKKMCPKCSSSVILQVVDVSGLLPDRLKCSNCGYVIPIYHHPKDFSNEEVSKIPDYVNPLVGYRNWAYSNGFLSSPIATNVIWEPNKRMECGCRNSSREWHKSPSSDCSCGLYAVKELDSNLTIPFLLNLSRHIFGEVYLWGKIIEHDLGYRAQYAYPKRLFLNEYQSPENLLDYNVTLGSLKIYTIPMLVDNINDMFMNYYRPEIIEENTLIINEYRCIRKCHFCQTIFFNDTNVNVSENYFVCTECKSKINIAKWIERYQKFHLKGEQNV